MGGVGLRFPQRASFTDDPARAAWGLGRWEWYPVRAHDHTLAESAISSYCNGAFHIAGWVIKMILMARRLSALFAILLLIGACDPLISSFSEEAYRNATSLKARSLALVDQSGEEYAAHRADAEQLLVDVDAAYEFVNGRPGNEISARQWDLMRDRDGGLLGGFQGKWREDGKLNTFFRGEVRALIASGFDTIICVEVNKRSADKCDNL